MNIGAIWFGSERVSPAGKYPLNSSFCPITLKSSSKDAGPGPASFELLFKVIGQKLKFSGYFYAAETLSDPNQIAHLADNFQTSTTPSVLNIIPSH